MSTSPSREPLSNDVPVRGGERVPATVTTLAEHQVTDAVALWAAAGLTRPWNDADADCRRALVGPDSTVLAVTDATGLAATAMVGHDGHRGWVYYLAVADRCRGRGLGALLMSACEEWVRERGIPKLQLMVRRDNADVSAFYDRLGYEASDVIVLGRRLDAS